MFGVGVTRPDNEIACEHHRGSVSPSTVSRHVRDVRRARRGEKSLGVTSAEVVSRLASSVITAILNVDPQLGL